MGSKGDRRRPQPAGRATQQGQDHSLTEEQRWLLTQRASEVRERSEGRVRARVPVRAPLSPEEVRWYDAHVLKEMAGLVEEIRAVPERVIRDALMLVFSSLVVKFSRQRSDTSEL